jgi:hypothetical protein
VDLQSNTGKVLKPIAKNIQEIYWILQSDTEDICDPAEFNTGIIFDPADKYRTILIFDLSLLR